MKLNEKIYYCRRKAGLSQDALAEAVGVSRQAISKWELGDAVPETAKLPALAAALGVSIDWLLSEDGPEEDAGPDRAAEAGCFTYDGSRAGGESAGPDGGRAGVGRRTRLDRPAAEAHTHGRAPLGWLAGVYVAICGLPMVILGALARGVSNRMFNSFSDFSGDIWGGGIGSTVIDIRIVDGVEFAVDGGSQMFNPVAAVGTVFIVIGVVLIIAGIALAAYLKSKSKQ